MEPGAQSVASGSTVYTDGLKSFTGLKEAGFQHVPRSQPLRTDLRKGAKSVVPLADRAIGNLQQWLIGTYHGVSRDQLQVYLDEFVFRKQMLEELQRRNYSQTTVNSYLKIVAAFTLVQNRFLQSEIRGVPSYN